MQDEAHKYYPKELDGHQHFPHDRDRPRYFPKQTWNNLSII